MHRRRSEQPARPPATIHWLRHCQSVANAGGPKTLDTPLSAAGAAAAEKLKGKYDIVYVSPMRRARETLGRSQIETPKVVVEPLLREIIEDPSDMLAEGERPEDSAAAAARVARLRDWLRGVAAHGGSVLVVSHGDLFWRLSSHVLGGTRYGTLLANGDRAVVENRWFCA